MNSDSPKELGVLYCSSDQFRFTRTNSDSPNEFRLTQWIQIHPMNLDSLNQFRFTNKTGGFILLRSIQIHSDQFRFTQGVQTHPMDSDSPNEFRFAQPIQIHQQNWGFYIVPINSDSLGPIQIHPMNSYSPNGFRYSP